jgi:hypothetical protein
MGEESFAGLEPAEATAVYNLVLTDLELAKAEQSEANVDMEEAREELLASMLRGRGGVIGTVGVPERGTWRREPIRNAHGSIHL